MLRLLSHGEPVFPLFFEIWGCLDRSAFVEILVANGVDEGACLADGCIYNEESCKVLHNWVSVCG